MNRSFEKIRQLSRSNNLHVYNAFKYTYCYLNMIAIWPLLFQNYNFKKIFTIIHVSVIIVVLVWQIVFRSYHIYFYAIDLDDQVTLLGPMLFVLVSLLKYLSLLYRGNFITKSIKHIYTDWSVTQCQEEKDIMIKKAEISTKITSIFSVIMYAGGLFYNFIMPHVIPLIFQSDHQKTSERLIIFPGYNIIRIFSLSPFYEITYFFYTIAALSCYTVLVGTCNLLVFLLSHADGQIDIVTVQFNSLIKDMKFSYAKMSTIIQNHDRVLQFSNKILKNVLSEICLVEIGATTILLCISEFSSLRLLRNGDIINTIPYIIIFGGLSLNMLILCYFSEILNSQFSGIGKQLYMTHWDKIPLNARKCLILIINMSQRTKKISVGGVIDLSYMTYLQIIKTGFAYLQILKASNI
ncbi:GSCOCT00000004001.2-RA-CDS [Cotesia congregata]|uniref:Odorant receptor n=1 Tax=Cotesia congregata TaxID=51543 RepID=A0A8J2MPX0_COTCN|nr:GSCOCT00000004001.2-RA-CDS [Cotesia congregata]CAG5100927.1 olfactory receptor 5 [Cotesia congregata]